MSSYIAAVIDTLNHDTSVNEILDSTSRIQELLDQHISKSNTPQQTPGHDLASSQ